jgi:hypothetical protein
MNFHGIEIPVHTRQVRDICMYYSGHESTDARGMYALARTLLMGDICMCYSGLGQMVAHGMQKPVRMLLHLGICM